MVLYTNQRMVIKMSRYIEVNCCGISHLMDYKDEKGLESLMIYKLKEIISERLKMTNPLSVLRKENIIRL